MAVNLLRKNISKQIIIPNSCQFNIYQSFLTYQYLLKRKKSDTPIWDNTKPIKR